MDFGNLLKQAKGAYEQYQDGNSGHNQGQNDGHQQHSGGPTPSNYQNEQRHESSGGFDMGQAAKMAAGYFSKDKNEHGQAEGHSSGGLDFAQIATMASGFMGSGHGSNNVQGDMISSALKMAMGGGFNKGEQASHDDIKSSYHSVMDSSSGSMASKGQNAMGLAAAYMALKKFQSGGGSSSGSGGQNQLVSMAMAEAKKLFGQHSREGGTADEKTTLATAAQAAMKLIGSK
ncbi:hypothetical protein IW148_006267 [Coemansia sp. RSA 1199]|nr:hypothetical protein IW148_006267 [Coemansia sp. RSA 1199]